MAPENQNESEEKQEQQEEEAKSRGLKSILVMAGAGIAVLAAAFFFVVGVIAPSMSKKDAADVAEEPAEPVAQEAMANYEESTIIVNLAGPDSERYLKVNLSLAVSDRAVVLKLEKQNARLRDELIDILSTKTVEDMLSPEGKDVLRTQIIEAANATIGEPKVVDVYFTEFVIQ